MAINTNVERLSSKSAPQAWGSLPDMPKLPQALIDRSPLYAQYDTDLQTWWLDTKAQLERILKQLSNAQTP